MYEQGHISNVWVWCLNVLFYRCWVLMKTYLCPILAGLFIKPPWEFTSIITSMWVTQLPQPNESPSPATQVRNPHWLIWQFVYCIAGKNCNPKRSWFAHITANRSLLNFAERENRPKLKCVENYVQKLFTVCWINLLNIVSMNIAKITIANWFPILQHFQQRSQHQCDRHVKMQ